MSGVHSPCLCEQHGCPNKKGRYVDTCGIGHLQAAGLATYRLAQYVIKCSCSTGFRVLDTSPGKAQAGLDTCCLLALPPAGA